MQHGLDTRMSYADRHLICCSLLGVKEKSGEEEGKQSGEEWMRRWSKKSEREDGGEGRKESK
jgi:hypothetical protein